jgi:hypothetical protein
MPIQPPSREELAQIASAFALHLTEEEIDAFYELAEPTAAGYARLDELEGETLPVKYPRAETGYRPTGEEDPSNGWSWRCSIPGAPEGPLAGRTVGIKDNVCVMDILGAALGNLHNTAPFDVTGNPALSVPCGMSDGRPIGMMMIGRHFEDATVLRAGHAYHARARAEQDGTPYAPAATSARTRIGQSPTTTSTGSLKQGVAHRQRPTRNLGTSSWSAKG